MRGFEDATWSDLINILDAKGFEQEDEFRFDLLSILEDFHVGPLEAVDHLPQNLQDAGEPGVLHLEDERFGTFFDDVAYKGNDKLTVLVLETVNKHLLDV